MNKIESMTKTVQQYHSSQFRNNGKIPYWYHCQSVAEILETAFRKSGEIETDSGLITDLYLASLGHDLYEDTEVSHQQIRDVFGERVDKFIKYLTNDDGDNDRKKYIQKVIEAPEEIKLIKLADLIDNTISCAYGIHDMGVEWTNKFLLPIVTEMKETIKLDSFVKYKKTAEILISQLEFSYQRLTDNLKKF